VRRVTGNGRGGREQKHQRHGETECCAVAGDLCVAGDAHRDR
jgi:hypothetical protein